MEIEMFQSSKSPTEFSDFFFRSQLDWFIHDYTKKVEQGPMRLRVIRWFGLRWGASEFRRISIWRKKISSAGTLSFPVNFCIGVAPKVKKSTTQRCESSTNTTLTYHHHLLLPLAPMAQWQRTTSEENRKTTLFKLPFGLDQSPHWWRQ